MTIVPGSGRLPSDLFFLGERPGAVEHDMGRPFVGPAGDELWARVWKVLRLTRDDVYTSNLVKTFAVTPPTGDEIARDAKHLRMELLQCRPKVIVTIGAYAARALLPQFAKVKSDVFHGLAFPFSYGTIAPRTAIVVPCVHSSAALRVPDKYQNQLTDDLRAVRRVLEGSQALHVPRRPTVYRVGLAGFGKSTLTLGLDTEGSRRSPECVTLSGERADVAVIEVNGSKPTKFLGAAIKSAKALAIHYAAADVPVLATLGIRDLPPIHDTMMQAYLLGLPQSLKVLAYRELGYVMDEYSDLVDPLDEALVKSTLTTRMAAWQARHDKLLMRATLIETRKAQGGRVTKKAVAARYKRLLRTDDVPPLKVVKALKRMIAAEATESVDDAD